MVHKKLFLPKAPSWLPLHGKSLIFRHLDCQEMWSPVFIYELHSPTNCLSTYQYHRLFYFKVRLGQKKASTTSIFETSHHYTHAIVSWILLSHVCLAKLWWFIILRACTLQVSTKSWRHPKYTISLLVILHTSWRKYFTHAHTQTHTHTHTKLRHWEVPESWL